MLFFNSKYKCQWITMIFLQDKHNINAVSENIKFMCILCKTGERLFKPCLLYPRFKPCLLYPWRKAV